MKSQIVKVLIFFVFILHYTYIHAVDLDSIPEKQRNRFLLSIAKEVVLRYGPDYFRDEPEPRIIRGSRRNYFIVIYPSRPEEKFEWGDAASISFDNRSGLPTSVLFGNGQGKIFTDEYKLYLAQKYYRNKSNNGINYKKQVEEEVVSPVKYQIVKPHIRYITNNDKSDSINNPKSITVPNGIRNSNKKLEYKGYYISGKDTIKMYKFVKDTIIP